MNGRLQTTVPTVRLVDFSGQPLLPQMRQSCTLCRSLPHLSAGNPPGGYAMLRLRQAAPYCLSPMWKADLCRRKM